ncbi:MAG: hypothetical protein J6B25_08285 [Clostridia bacterium]|nr:hypothetical protein [Clostridia bacterium]
MWLGYLVFGVGGALFITMALVRIIQMKRCTEVVDGWFLDTVRVFNVRYHTTKAKFFYVYDGKEYYGLTDLGISMKQMNEFSKSFKYTLFVNPKNPKKFAYDKKLTIGNEIIPLIMGAVLLLIPLAIKIWLDSYRYF